jgi:hypothetical protein
VRPSIIKYAGPYTTPKQVLTAQVSSVQATMQPGRKLKSEWAAAFHGPLIPVPSTQERDVTAPSILQHALPGPSGTQVQPGFANVSIFTSTYRNIYIYFFQCFFLVLSFSLFFNTV